MEKRGKLFVLEGLDGSGKGTREKYASPEWKHKHDLLKTE